MSYDDNHYTTGTKQFYGEDPVLELRGMQSICICMVSFAYVYVVIDIIMVVSIPH